MNVAEVERGPARADRVRRLAGASAPAIRAGDVITAVDGHSLAGKTPQRGDGADQGPRGHAR